RLRLRLRLALPRGRRPACSESLPRFNSIPPRSRRAAAEPAFGRAPRALVGSHTRRAGELLLAIGEGPAQDGTGVVRTTSTSTSARCAARIRPLLDVAAHVEDPGEPSGAPR